MDFLCIADGEGVSKAATYFFEVSVPIDAIFFSFQVSELEICEVDVCSFLSYFCVM